MKSSAITIKQISSLSGYSISTVSKALNDKLEISKATRDSIKTIAKQHNYVPNTYAVSLRIQKTGSIAVIVPEITQACYSHSLCHLQKSAERLGYRILFYQSFNSNKKELSYIKNLSNGSIDGMIVVSSENKRKSQYTGNSFPVELLYLNASASLDEIEKLSYSSLLNVLKSN